MRGSRQPAVYILANLSGTLYIGVTRDLRQRVWQHRTNVAGGFTQRYALRRLVYYELHGVMSEAIRREKQLKRWRRKWKLQLIKNINPGWRDLYEEVI